jgi:aspartokinase
MAKKVLKFGGTSVGTIERILHVAKIIKKEYESGNEEN